MKKFICMILAISMAAIAMTTVAAEGDVEIKFSVGDSNLSINGTLTEVQTPYVVGEGTTLVPLRVITEAFGAEVEWIDETKTINLTYPDIKISLQIDNYIAKINDGTQTLEAAPELTNGTTMVPLRFISETFGADVKYDDATKAITVTKTKLEFGQSITGITDCVYSGNSFYVYSFETPKSLTLFDSTSNMRYIGYSNGNGSSFCVVVENRNDYTEEYDSKKALEKMKEMAQGSTLMEAQTSADMQGNKMAYMKAKNENGVLEEKIIFTNNYIYTVSAIYPSEDKEMKAYLSGIFNSFRTIYDDKSDIYDLSVLNEDGYYTYTNDEYSISLLIPEYMSVGEENNNEIRFYSDTVDNFFEYVAIGIYSKSDEVSAESLALKDFEHNKVLYNPELTTCSEELEEFEISGVNGVKYDIIRDGTSKKSAYLRDIFFELGDYVYNVAISVPVSQSEACDKIAESVSAQMLDSDEIEKIIRNEKDFSEPFVADETEFKFEIAGNWEEFAKGSDSVYMYKDQYTGAIMTIASQRYIKGGVDAILKSAREQLFKDYNCTVKKHSDIVVCKNVSYRKNICLLVDKEGVESYAVIYAVQDDGFHSMIVLFLDDVEYNGLITQQVEEMVKNSLELKTW